jgi:hypothetical protein
MKKLGVGQLIAMAAALLVLLFFFFPWIEINMLLAATNLSGFQLASGNGPAGAKFPGVPSLFLVPLSMVGVLVLVGISFSGQGAAAQLKSVAAILILAAGGISVLVILYQYFNLNQQFNQNVMGMIAQKMFSYSFGAHASLFGSAVVAGGGLLDLVRRPKKPTP